MLSVSRVRLLEKIGGVMERDFWSRAILEVVKFIFFSLVGCLLAESVFAFFVRSFALPSETVRTVNWIIQAVACTVCGIFTVRSERALFKGMAGGVLSVLVTMLVFGFIGGFHLNALFLLKLLLGALCGGAGAILGVKLRKE